MLGTTYSEIVQKMTFITILLRLKAYSTDFLTQRKRKLMIKRAVMASFTTIMLLLAAQANESPNKTIPESWKIPPLLLSTNQAVELNLTV